MSQHQTDPSWLFFCAFNSAARCHYMSVERRMFLICKGTQKKKKAPLWQKLQSLEVNCQLTDWVCVMVRDADSDSGNCQEDCCVQGEAEALQSFITLGLIGSFQDKVSVPVMCAVSQPEIWEMWGRDSHDCHSDNSTFQLVMTIYLHVFDYSF